MLQQSGISRELESQEKGILQTAGTIFDVMKYSTHDGPGIRTTVFLKGCPLHCWWCHNPEGQSPAPQLVFRTERCIHCLGCVKACPNHAIEVVDGNPIVVGEKCRLDGFCVSACQTGAREIAGKRVTVAGILEAVERDTVFYDESGGGVTFSGGEPFMQPIFLKTLLKLCKERRIHTAVETCGFVDSSTLLSSVADVDLLLYDLKVMDDERHREFTGVPNNRILENLKKLSNSQVEIIVRFPVIPGVNDYDGNVSRIGEFVSELGNVKEIDILPYHELGIEKYKQLGLKHNMPEVQLLSTERLTEIGGKLESYGLRVKVGG